MKNFFFLFLLSLNFNYSQGLDSLFTDDLPSSIKNKIPDLSILGGTVAALGEINPDLIYCFLKFAEARYDSAIGDAFYLEYNSRIIRYYKSIHDQWIHHLESELQQQNIDGSLRTLCVDFVLSKLFGEEEITIPQLQEKIDKNKLDYFAIKYYSRDNSYRYNQNEDYHTIRLDVERTKRAQIERFLIIPYGSKADLDQLFSNWYLFYNNRDKDDFLIESVINILKKHYANSVSKFSIVFGYSRQNSFLLIPTYNSQNEFRKRTEEKIEINAQFPSAFIEYRLIFSEYIHSFNYVNLQFGFGTIQLNNFHQLNDYGFFSHTVNPNSGLHTLYRIIKSEINIEDKKYFSANISTPFYFLFRNFSFNAGVGLVFIRTTYNYCYQYEYREFYNGYYGPEVIKDVIDNADAERSVINEYSVYTLFRINYEPIETIRFNFTIANYDMSFGLGINL